MFPHLHTSPKFSLYTPPFTYPFVPFSSPLLHGLIIFYFLPFQLLIALLWLLAIGSSYYMVQCLLISSCFMHCSPRFPASHTRIGGGNERRKGSVSHRWGISSPSTLPPIHIKTCTCKKTVIQSEKVRVFVAVYNLRENRIL